MSVDYERPGGRRGRLRWPRFSAAQYWPVLGPVQSVPPRGCLKAPLRGLHLDNACAPVVTWQLSKKRDGVIS